MNSWGTLAALGLLVTDVCWGQPHEDSATHPVNVDLQDVGKNLEREQQLLQQLKQESSTLLQTMGKIENELHNARNEQEQAKKQLLDLEQTLIDNRKQRQDAMTLYRESRRRLGMRLRSLYKLGEVGWMNLIFGAESVEQGMDRLRLLQHQVSSDRLLMTDTIRRRKELLLAEQTIRERRIKLQGLKEQVENRRQQAEAAKGVQAKALVMVQKEKVLHQKMVSELKQARQRLLRVISMIEGQSSEAKGFRSWQGRLHSPVDGAGIEVPFGLQIDKRFKTKTQNQGVDIRAKEGAEVKAVYPGQVVFAGTFEGYGLLVILDHGGGYFTLYAHLDSLLVSKGGRVNLNQPVGTLGDTGSLKGPYLYFEVRENGKAVNPEKWVRF